MANNSRSRSGNSSSRSAKTGAPKRTTRSNRARSSSAGRKPAGTKAPVHTETEEESVIRRFASSKAAMPLIFIASVILITGIDLLISWNKYEMFFKILGVEILVAVIVWVILTLVFSGRAKKDNSSASVEDEV